MEVPLVDSTSSATADVIGDLKPKVLPTDFIPKLPPFDPGHVFDPRHVPDLIFPWYIYNRDLLKTFSAAPARGVDSTAMLSPKDLSSLAFAFAILKESRKSMNSDDNSVASKAKTRIFAVSAYIVGLLDGKGVATSGSHIVSIAQLTAPVGKLDQILDELIAALDSIVMQGDTRSVIGGIAKVVAGAIVIAYGVPWAAELPV